MIAHVDGDVIFNTDVVERAELFKKLNKPEYDHYFANQQDLFMQEMQSLVINEVLLHKEAERFNIYVNDNDIFAFLIEQGMFRDVQMINDFVQDQHINFRVWVRSLRFHLLMERFRKIFFEKEARISADEETIMKTSFAKENKVYHVKKIPLADIAVDELENLSCDDVAGDSFGLHLAEMNEELQHSFQKLKKKNFSLNDKQNIILLCDIEEKGEEDFVAFKDAMFQERMHIVTEDFFARLRMRYVTFEEYK